MQIKAEERVFTSILRYASSSLFRRALAGVTAILRPLLLAPEMYGLWTILKVFPTYSSYLHFGSRSAMRFRIPRCEVNGDTETIDLYKASVFYGSALPVLLAAAVLLLVAALGSNTVEAKVGLVGVSLVMVLNWRYDFFISLLKAHQKFKVISGSNYLKASTYLFFTATFVWILGFYGVVLTAVATVFLTNWYIRKLGRVNVPRLADARWHVYTDLVRDGLPIMVFDFIVLFLRTSDRFVLLYFFDTATVGLYGLAVMFMGLTLSVPAVAREVIEPRLMQSLDHAAIADVVRGYMTGPILHTVALMPIVVGWGVLLMPTFIHLALPNYVGAVEALVLLLLGSYFTAAVYAIRGIVVAARLQFGASLILILALFFSLTLSFGLLSLGAGMEAVALSTSLSFCLLLIVLLVYVHYRLPAAGISIGYHLAIVLLPFALLCLLLFVPFGEQTLLPREMHDLLVHITIFTLVQGALLLVMWRRGLIFLGGWSK